MSYEEEVVQLSQTSDAQQITLLNMLLEFPIGAKKVRLLSASMAPTQAGTVVHGRIGFSFQQSTGEDGSIDYVEGAARRYYPLVLNYPRIMHGPGKLYAAVLARTSATPDPFTFNVAYQVVV